MQKTLTLSNNFAFTPFLTHSIEDLVRKGVLLNSIKFKIKQIYLMFEEIHDSVSLKMLKL